METRFDLELRDTEENHQKLRLLNKLEVAFDDEINGLPASYYDFVENVPMGSTIRVTLEVIESV